jgi:hypothetical protein
MSKKIKLSSLIQDDKNNNKHTAYGMDLLEKSVNKVGIIESITVSNDDKIISGNARHEIIGKNFTKEALVIETDGTQPIIIKRTDIESDTKKFYEASILANTTSKKNIDFDMEVIDSLAVEYDIDVVDLGVDVIEEEHLEAEEDDFNGVPPKEPSGSTMVASHQLKRKCYGMELDPKYCDVIVARMIKLDSTLPIKRNGTLLTKSELDKFTANTSDN